MSNSFSNTISVAWQWCRQKSAAAWKWYKGLYQGRPWYVKTLAAIVSLVVAFFLYLGAVDILNLE